MKAALLITVLVAGVVSGPVLAQGAAGTDTAPVRTTPFPDVPKGHWAYDAVEQLRQLGILRGYPGGVFEPAPARARASAKKPHAVAPRRAPKQS